MHLFDRQERLQVLLTFLSAASVASGVITAGQIPAANQTWGFNPSDRCRLLAHKSVIVKNDKQNILVIEGGFGSFQTKVNGTTQQVLDLNPFTAAFDLSKDFSTPGLYPSWFYRKPYNSTQRFTVTNFGGLWTSEDGNTIWYQGGHYYNADHWNDGLYHVDKSEIPEWQLWQMDVNNHQNGWKDVTNNTNGHELANRTFAGGAVTVAGMKTSYWLGGLLDRTTSATSPNDTLKTTQQMLIYNESSNTVTEQKYYSADSTDGYYQGGLVHLPIGPKSGYLISLMSLKKSIETPWVDPDGESGNTELADPVTLDSIPLYDLETGEWFEQETAWFMDQVPQPRTRFCSALFHDTSDNTWNLWVHGGQLLSDQNSGLREIYVLSMPSFIWSKVETTLSDTNLIRSHTCHAVGSQLVIVGGYPPSVYEVTNATCDAEYVKVLNIGEDSISWDGSFSPSTEYKTPKTIRNVVNGRQAPIAGFATTKLQADFAHNPKSSKKNIGAIAGGVVGGLVVLAIVGFFVVRKLRQRKADRRATPHGTPERNNLTHGHSSLEAGAPPELIKDGNQPEVRQTTHHIHEVSQSYGDGQSYGVGQSYGLSQSHEVNHPPTRPMAELESPEALRAVSPIENRYSRAATDYRLDS